MGADVQPGGHQKAAERGLGYDTQVTQIHFKPYLRDLSPSHQLFSWDIPGQGACGSLSFLNSGWVIHLPMAVRARRNCSSMKAAPRNSSNTLTSTNRPSNRCHFDLSGDDGIARSKCDAVGTISFKRKHPMLYNIFRKRDGVGPPCWFPCALTRHCAETATEQGEGLLKNFKVSTLGDDAREGLDGELFRSTVPDPSLLQTKDKAGVLGSENGRGAGMKKFSSPLSAGKAASQSRGRQDELTRHVLAKLRAKAREMTAVKARWNWPACRENWLMPRRKISACSELYIVFWRVHLGVARRARPNRRPHEGILAV